MEEKSVDAQMGIVSQTDDQEKEVKELPKAREESAEMEKDNREEKKGDENEKDGKVKKNEAEKGEEEKELSKDVGGKDRETENLKGDDKKFESKKEEEVEEEEKKIEVQKEEKQITENGKDKSVEGNDGDKDVEGKDRETENLKGDDEKVESKKEEEEEKKNEARKEEKQITENDKDKSMEGVEGKDRETENLKGDDKNVESKKEEQKKSEAQREDVSSCNINVSSCSFKEESNLFSDLKENERKALVELRSKVEEAIKGNMLFKEKEKQITENDKDKLVEGNDGDKEKETKEDHRNKGVEEDNGKEKEKQKENEGKDEEKPVEKDTKEKEDRKKEDDKEVADSPGEEKKAKEEELKMMEKEENPAKIDSKENKQEGEEKENVIEEVEKEMKDENIEEKVVDYDKDVALWGVPLLPSKGDRGTDVVLLKFLRAREFKVNETFEMLRSTLQWRKENNIDSILEEDFGEGFGSAAYMNGKDRQGHPVCYNIFGVLGEGGIYEKALESEEKREVFLKWRLQLMEQGIQKLDFKPGGASCLLQISDLKNTPGPSKKEVRLAAKQAVAVLQDNYPEFVAKNIFINVPFWYYAFATLLSPFLTQRTKSKFIYARPSKVTETLLKYIATEELPICYGGFMRDNDPDFSAEDAAIDGFIKSGSTDIIEIPAPEVGNTLIWDVIVLGWEVNYKEEFIPDDENSYTIIVQKGKRIGLQEEPIRNSFKYNEPGKVVITIENSSFKKKRFLYRYKTKNSPPF